MGVTRADAESEAFIDLQLTELEKEISSRKKETVQFFISEGFTESESITSRIFYEISKLINGEYYQSIGFLSGVLLETIERETLCLPLIVSGLGLLESDKKRIEQIKKMISRGVDPSLFITNYFENTQNGTQAMAQLKKLVTSLLPNHQFFKVESNLSKYREKVQGMRNQVAHGRTIVMPNEATYVYEFTLLWREIVYNQILADFGLKLDANWMLSDIKDWTPDTKSTKAKRIDPDNEF